MHPTSATTSLCERRPGGVQETPDANEAVPDLLDDDISEELLLGESYGYYKLETSMLVVIRLTCSMHGIYAANTASENRRRRHPQTNNAYVLQYSDTRAR
jgi:hypothetical protein